MIYNPKIYVDKSPVHGCGVFAKEDIVEGEVFEECPVLTLPIEKGEVTSLLIDYRFNWPQYLLLQRPPNHEQGFYQHIFLGCIS